MRRTYYTFTNEPPNEIILYGRWKQLQKRRKEKNLLNLFLIILTGVGKEKSTIEKPCNWFSY